MKYFLYGILAGMLYTLTVSHAFGQPLVIAVLDSGLTATPEDVPTCIRAPSDLSKNRHGSNVAGLIAREAAASEGYCLLIFRVFSYDSKGEQYFNVSAYFRALELLARELPFAINLSFGGTAKLPTEVKLIKNLLDRKVHIIAAAGNESRNLAPACNFYPACLDPRIIVVGNISHTSNYGPQVDKILNGNYQTAGGVTLSGTSQSAAIYTGRLIRTKLETGTQLENR